METIKPLPVRESRAVMAVLAMSLLLASLGTSIANIALPALSQAMAAPFAQVQWVAVAYLAALTVSVVLAGRLGDIHGLRRMHLVGLGLFAIASLLCGLAPNLSLLVAARAVQGVGAAFLMALSLALARETAGAARMGRAMGFLGTASAVGTALGPSLGGVVLSVAGWRGIFLVQVPVAVLVLGLAFWSLPRRDVPAGPTGAGFAGALAATPLSGLVMNLLVAAVMMTTLFVGPFYLGLGLGLSAWQVGLVMSVGPTISIVGGVASGRAVDHWGASRVLTAGLVLLVAGATALAVLPQAFGLGGYVLGVAVLTPGYQLFQAANTTAVLAGVPADKRGVASGLLNLSRNMGLILGASAMGAVFALGVGTGDFTRATPDAITQGLRLVFGSTAAMMALALGIARWRDLRP